MVSTTLLPDNRSLTNGEYCTVIHRIDTRSAQGFSDLLGTLDKTIYGNRPIDSNAMQDLFIRADHVLGDCLRIGRGPRENRLE